MCYVEIITFYTTYNNMNIAKICDCILMCKQSDSLRKLVPLFFNNAVIQNLIF